MATQLTELAKSIKDEFGDNSRVALHFAKALIAEAAGNTAEADAQLDKAIAATC